ncbi:hypothetical protein [Galbibacter sp. EGI 63066]|uniref:hypothetical protein n=1 Tax=Galbibacter sp. EGI 63066 TaxID=2993559 RepID=UPI002248A799|nr:hypothetical protein [Galbibacter sp. EGI 63066]
MNRKSRATNDSLNDLFKDIDSIQIKSDGVHNNKAISDNIVLRIDKPSKIQEFKNLIAIEEPKKDFRCMCLGDYAIELLNDEEPQSAIGFHHGISIRCNQWTGDADLKYADELLQFLYDLGLKEPLEEKKLDYERARKSKEESNNWLMNSPKSFSNYWNEINDFDNSYFPLLINDLKKEYADKNSLIVALLRSFGTSKDLWNAYPIYESISQKILNEYELQEIIDAFLISDKDLVTRIGLGRYIFSWDFREEIKKHQNKLNKELIELLYEAFETINDLKGMESIKKIKDTANNS